MKRNYLWMLLASMAFVGCSQNDDLPEGNENQNGEKEVSYIAINVNATPSVGSRAAADGGFSYGTADENKVATACFFFYDADGDPFSVSGKTPTSTTGTANWIKVSYTSDAGVGTTGNPVANVERVMESVLVLEKVKDSYPKSVVAVLNWEPTGTENVTLANLRKALLTNYQNASNYFYISNSVYKSGEDVVYATPLTEAHFAADATSAQNRPVDIYVERVAAKAMVGIKTDNNANYITIGSSSKEGFDTGIDASIDGAQTTTDIFAEILGWTFNTTNDQSYLMKDLDGVTTDPFTNWNDATNYRSYWAVASAASASGYGNLKFTWNSISSNVGQSGYCLENTNETNTTKVIVKAQLVDNTGTVQDLAQWYGSYFTINGLKTAVATSLANKMVDRTSVPDVAIAADDIDFAYAATDVPSPTDQNYYTIVFKLSSTGAAKTWTDPTTGTALDSDEANAVLAGVTPAKYWKDGATYYYLPIEHLGDKKAVIRNHSYEILVENVQGLGTPVPSPGDPVPPVKPEDTETYIAARINVLSWKLITNEVILQ